MNNNTQVFYLRQMQFGKTKDKIKKLWLENQKIKYYIIKILIKIKNKNKIFWKSTKSHGIRGAAKKAFLFHFLKRINFKGFFIQNKLFYRPWSFYFARFYHVLVSFFLFFSFFKKQWHSGHIIIILNPPK